MSSKVSIYDHSSSFLCPLTDQTYVLFVLNAWPLADKVILDSFTPWPLKASTTSSSMTSNLYNFILYTGLGVLHPQHPAEQHAHVSDKLRVDSERGSVGGGGDYIGKGGVGSCRPR